MHNLGRIIKQQRLAVPLTLRALATVSGVSVSHLGRIERGERFPSAGTLKRIARPLGFTEDKLFTLAGFLSPSSEGIREEASPYLPQLDAYVANVLAKEPPEVQRTVIGILSLLKSLAKSTQKE